jgi:hypothetical protein
LMNVSYRSARRLRVHSANVFGLLAVILLTYTLYETHVYQLGSLFRILTKTTDK